MQPRIILSTKEKAKKYHKGNDTVATAWIRRGVPTIHVWRPRLFTRRVLEHELAHLRQRKVKGKETLIHYLQKEVEAERMAAKAMGKDTELDTFRVMNFVSYFYKESYETVPHFRKYIKNIREFVKYGNSGFFKECGLTDKEIGKFNRAMARKDKDNKIYNVTLRIKKGDRQQIFGQEVIADSKRDAYDMVTDNVPAVDGRWDVVKSEVKRIK